MTDRFGAPLLFSTSQLLKKAHKLEGKHVFVYGRLRTDAEVVYLGPTSGDQVHFRAGSICLRPDAVRAGLSASHGQAVLTRFDGETLAVHGIYEKSEESVCPNGVIFTISLQQSLE